MARPKDRSPDEPDGSGLIGPFAVPDPTPDGDPADREEGNSG
jgi:hypothetical protein